MKRLLGIMNSNYYLILDRGNTRLKVAIFNDTKEIVEKSIIDSDFIVRIEEITKKYLPKATLFSASGKKNEEVANYLKKRKDIIFLDSKTPIPIIIKYKTPETLGVDRIANACAVYAKHPKKNTLTIDFGTCITYDFIDKSGNFLGGAISPGVTMRAKAMNNYTANLPLIQPKETTSFIGDDTNSCLNVGIIEAIKHEINGFIHQFEEEFKQINVFLTGGDHSYFVNTIENSIFADLNLTAKGLNEILQHNI